VVGKNNDGDDDNDHDGHSRDNPPSSILSYFVSRMVHQVSAPPENTDETTHRQHHKQKQVPILDLEQEENTEHEDDSDSIPLPMETIWEDSVCTEYVFVPYSETSENNVEQKEYIRRMVDHSSRLKKLHCVIQSLFSSERNVCTTSSAGDLGVQSRIERQGINSRSSMIQSVFFESLISLSS
jgi:hypothetical protein